MEQHNQRWLNVDEVSNYVRKSKRAVYNLVHKEAIPYTKIGASLRFDRVAIDRWLEANAVLPR